MLDHVDIRVADRDASERFYDTVLRALGKKRLDAGPEHIDWGEFTIVADGQPVAKHLDIAFSARSHELEQELRDPDGNRVEVVYTGKPGAIAHLRLRTRDVAAIRRFYVAAGYELGVDEPDHVQLGPVSYVAGEPVTEELCRHFDEGQRVELTVTAAFYSMVPRVLDALEVPIEGR